MSEDNKKVEAVTEVKAEVVEAKSPPVAEPVVMADEKSTTDFEVPAKFKDLVTKIESMSVLELNELVGVFEKKFGVSAQAVAMSAGANAGGEVAEEKDSFTVELTSSGEQKIQVIKAVKEVLGLGLKEAKDLVDAVPSVLKEDVKKEDAEAMKKRIEEAGGKVTLK